MSFFARLSSLKKLSLILAVLVVLLLLESVFQGFGDSKKNAFLFSSTPFDSVQSINLSRSGSTTRLIFEEGQWFVLSDQSFAADSARIDEFMKLLTDLSSVELVSTNPERQAVFHVDDASGSQISLWNANDKLVADFYLGKTDARGRQYFRLTDSDKVLLVDTNFSAYISGGATAWRDHTVAEMDESDIKRIALTDESGERVLDRQDDQWIIFDTVLRDAEDLAMRTLLGRLAMMQAEGFASNVEASQFDFDNPDRLLAVRFKDDSLKTLSFVEADDGLRYYLKTDQSDFIYWVSPSFVGDLFGLKF